MTALMFVTPTPAHGPPGGRAMLSRLHEKCLRSILPNEFHIYRLDPQRPSGLRERIRALRGQIDGATEAAGAALLRQIKDGGVSRVWLDGSNLGHLARIIKRAVPALKVFTFFHNVEATFFAGSLRRAASPRALAVLIANSAAERMAVRFSDRLVALSKRESHGLQRLYGRPATDTLPMALEDKLSPDATLEGKSGGHLIFVGGAFYANLAGIRWFASNVAPRIELVTQVVGLGLDKLRGSIDSDKKVEVIGAVDELQDHYLDAKAVIAPIFSGSGMKTKVAEALMFGKQVIGTAEAFSGYEDVATQVGWTCETPDQWVAAIEAVAAKPPRRFDVELRLLYERHHSYEATVSRLSAILGVEG